MSSGRGPCTRRGFTLVEVIVAILILTCGLTALAHLTGSAVRAATVARVLEAGHARLGQVVDSLQRVRTAGSGARTFPHALGPSAAPPITVEWAVPDDPGLPARVWFSHPALRDPVEIHFVMPAPW